jgi:hypothetical protein
MEKMAEGVAAFQRREAYGPDSVSSLDDVEKLQRWLDRKRASEEEISELERERVKKLVTEARQLFGSIEEEIVKNYCTIALRSNLEP